MVEDHPYNYGAFEGIIPKGNYGAGTVMVWDEGTYEPSELLGDEKETQDKNLRHQLYSGKIKFTLSGKKLKGAYALVKANGRGENAWLLMKLNDGYSAQEDILLKNKSVISRKTLDESAVAPSRVYGQSAKNLVKEKKSDISLKKRKSKSFKKNNITSSAKTKLIHLSEMASEKSFQRQSSRCSQRWWTSRSIERDGFMKLNGMATARWH